MVNVDKIHQAAETFCKYAQVESDAQKIADAEARIYRAIGLRTSEGRETMGEMFQKTMNVWAQDVWDAPLKAGDTISVEMSASPGGVKIWPTINGKPGPDPRSRFGGAGLSSVASKAVLGLNFPPFARTLSSPTQVG